MAKKKKQEQQEETPQFTRRAVPVADAKTSSRPPRRGRYKCCG
jgi:hypothetical protein